MFAELKGLTPAKFSRLIDALWRDYLVMYNENKLAYSDLQLLDETNPIFDERYRYVRNNFRTDEGDLVNSWSTAQGYGHQILADFAQVFGFFNYAISQFETVMGPFSAPATIATDHPSAKSWKKTDRLFTLGNGTDNLDRSNALVIYKSGLVEWYNAQVFGSYSHQNPGEPEKTPKDGTLQFTLANNFEYWKNGQWNSLGGDQHNPATTAEGSAPELTIDEDQVVNLDLSAYAKTSDLPKINFATLSLNAGTNTINFATGYSNTDYTFTYNAYIQPGENARVYVITKNTGSIVVRATYACTIEYQAIGN